MTKVFDPKHAAEHGYTKDDWDDVDSPELTEEELATARPLKEAMPELYAALTKRAASERPPDLKPAKALVTLRVDQDVLDAFKAGGEGWQTRMNEALRKALP